MPFIVCAWPSQIAVQTQKASPRVGDRKDHYRLILNRSDRYKLTGKSALAGADVFTQPGSIADIVGRRRDRPGGQS